MTYLEALLARRPIEGLVVNCHAHIDATWGLPRDMSPESMLAVMDRLGIDVACISSARALTADVRGGNDRMISAVERWPGRLVGVAAVNPNYGDEIRPELERCFEHPGVGMIKLHPEAHGHAIDAPGYEPVWPFAADHRIPILVHTWGEGRGLDHPSQVGRLAERFPAIPFILGHSGGTPDGLRLSAGLARRLPNIFLDTGTSPSYRRALETLVDEGGANRVLFGTDGSYLADPPQLGKVAGAMIADDAKRAIFGENMAALLRGTGRPAPALEGR